MALQRGTRDKPNSMSIERRRAEARLELDILWGCT
jgi:hypothetical protein